MLLSLEPLDGWPWPLVLSGWDGVFGPCRFSEVGRISYGGWSTSKADCGVKEVQQMWSELDGTRMAGGVSMEQAQEDKEDEIRHSSKSACHYRHEHAVQRTGMTPFLFSFSHIYVSSRYSEHP